MGHVAIEATGNPLPDETLYKAQQSDAILFGAVGHAKYDNDPTAKVRPEQGLLKIRKELGLYANLLIPVWAAIPLIAALTFICCALTSYLISKIPGSRWIIG